MSARTFVVTVTQSPNRVVVEDVRNRRRSVATDLAALGEQIAWLIQTPPDTETGAARRQANQAEAKR